jgi:hypothetical protein
VDSRRLRSRWPTRAGAPGLAGQAAVVDHLGVGVRPQDDLRAVSQRVGEGGCRRVRRGGVIRPQAQVVDDPVRAQHAAALLKLADRQLRALLGRFAQAGAGPAQGGDQGDVVSLDLGVCEGVVVQQREVRIRAGQAVAAVVVGQLGLGTVRPDGHQAQAGGRAVRVRPLDAFDRAEVRQRPADVVRIVVRCLDSRASRVIAS